MTIYVSGRQSGKTTFLIRQSADTGAVIVAPDPARWRDTSIVWLATLVCRFLRPLLSPIGFEAWFVSLKTMTKPTWWMSCKWLYIN